MTSTQESIWVLDQGLRNLDKQSKENVLEQMAEEVRQLGEDYWQHYRVPHEMSREEAVHYRKIHVPILYKLGMTHEASKLAQKTFECLAPDLHRAVQERLIDLLGEDYQEKAEVLAKYYMGGKDVAASAAYRIKSTHSIWKKVGSLKAFQEMNKQEFLECVDDLIGIRWEMNLAASGNRYDALVQGVREASKEHLVTFRNQQLSQSSGFDCEPIMKLCYQVEGMSIELQILGGHILCYMCAKGYAAYKTDISFFPSKTMLTEHLWQQRLNRAIQLEESKNWRLFRKEMLLELMGEMPDYSQYDPFILDEKPVLEENRLWSFPGYTQPIWMLRALKIEGHS